MSHPRRQFLAAAGSTLAGLAAIATASPAAASTVSEAAPHGGVGSPPDQTRRVTRRWSMPATRTAPAVDPQRRQAYVAHEDSVTARHLDSGDEVWSVAIQAHGVALAGDTVLLSAPRGAPPSIHAIDPADGSLQWTATIAGDLLSAPVVHDGQVYLETSIESSRIEAPIDDSVVEQNDDREEIGRIEAYSLATGEQTWRVEHDGQLRVDSTADETVVIRAIPDDWLREDEAIYALDAATGTTHWQRVEDAPTATWSPGALVYCTQPSEQRLRARDPLEGTVEWERAGDVGPAIRAGADGRVVLTTRERVLAIEEATGTVEWEHEVGESPQPVDAVVDPDRELVYAATRDRPAYLAGGSTTTESTTVLARRLDSGEAVWARTCPRYSSARLALGGDSVSVTSWRGSALASGCTALDPSTGAVQFRSAIDGTRIATPPSAPGSPTLIVERGDAGDGPQLHALTATTAAQSADRGPPETTPGSTTVEIRDAAVVAVEHTDTVGVAVTLDPDATTGAQISLTSADGSQSVRVTGTALTEATDDGRLQTASVERGNLPFTPTTCVIETDDTTRTIAID